jgi:hypothetical protein
MPQDAIKRVGQMGHQQKMPKTLTFADHFGFELPDVNDDVDDDHDSNYEPDGDESANDSVGRSDGCSRNLTCTRNIPPKCIKQATTKQQTRFSLTSIS